MVLRTPSPPRKGAWRPAGAWRVREVEAGNARLGHRQSSETPSAESSDVQAERKKGRYGGRAARSGTSGRPERPDGAEDPPEPGLRELAFGERGKGPSEGRGVRSGRSPGRSSRHSEKARHQEDSRSGTRGNVSAEGEPPEGSPKGRRGVTVGSLEEAESREESERTGNGETTTTRRRGKAGIGKRSPRAKSANAGGRESRRTGVGAKPTSATAVGIRPRSPGGQPRRKAGR
jgi:hypothetical protein